MNDDKRWWSMAVVAFFCLLCLGTSKSKSIGPPGPLVSASGAPWAAGSAPVAISYNTRVKGRLDPLDPKVKDGTGNYDAYVVVLTKGQKYQVRVQPEGSAPAPTADAGPGSVWFTVRVMTGAEVAPERAIPVEERTHEGGSTYTAFTAAVEGEHTITVSALFRRDGNTHPGFASYDITVLPIE